MDNSTLFRRWKDLAPGRRDDFSKHLLAWAGETGADQLAFLTFGEEHHVQGMDDDFLRQWNAYCEANLKNMNLGKDFVPNARGGKERCDIAWLNKAVLKLFSWWASFRVLETMRESSFFKALSKLRSQSEWEEYYSSLKEICSGNVMQVQDMAAYIWNVSQDSTKEDLGKSLKQQTHGPGGDKAFANRLGLLHRNLATFLCRRKLRRSDACQLIYLLDPSEHQDFLWWTTRPRYHSKGKDIKALATLVLDKVINGKGICKEELFHLWVRAKPQNDDKGKHQNAENGKCQYDERGKNRLRSGLKILAKIAEDYLVQADDRSNESKKSIALLQTLNRRGGDKIFVKLYALAAATLKPGDESYFESRHALENCKVQYEMGTPDRGQRNIYRALITFTAEHAAVELMRQACDALAHQLVSGIQADLSPVRLLQPLAQPGLPLTPLAQAFQQAWLMLEHPQEKRHLEKLLEMLRKEKDDFGQDALRRLYKYALNVCMAQVNLSRKEYNDTMNQIFVDTLNTGILLKDGVIECCHLRNIIVANARNGNLDAAKRFYEEYKDKIDQAKDPCTPAYLAAMIQYYEQPAQPEYLKLIGIFKKLSSDTRDEYYKIDTWVFRFRIAIDNANWDFVLKNARNFGLRLTRCERIPAEQIKKFQDFCRHTATLGVIRAWMSRFDPYEAKDELPEMAEKLTSLWEEVVAERHIAAHTWLKEKIQAAMAGFPTLPPGLGA